MAVAGNGSASSDVAACRARLLSDGLELTALSWPVPTSGRALSSLRLES